MTFFITVARFYWTTNRTNLINMVNLKKHEEKLDKNNKLIKQTKKD